MGILCVIIVSILSTFAIVFYHYKKSFQYWKARGIPYDEPSIPFGSLKGVGKTILLHDVTKRLYDEHKPTGAKLCGAYFFFRPVTLLLGLELVKCVFIKEFNNFVSRGNFYHNAEYDPLTANLFTVVPEKWKILRSKLTPTFASGKMKFMFPTVVNVVDRFRDCLFERFEQNDELEMKDLFQRYTTDAIVACAFGIQSNSLNDPNDSFQHFSRKVFDKPRHNAFIFLLLSEFQTIGNKLHVKSIRDDVSAFFRNAIYETVDYREKNDIVQKDFIDHLMKLRNQKTIDGEEFLTLNEIAAQSFLFFLAGFETSATTMTFCAYELASHPNVQAKARNVIQGVLKKHDGQFTYEALMDMRYIDQILEETLRMYPPAPNLTRRAENDYRVPETDVVIEKGMTVVIPVYAIHYDPDIYPNPEEFDPDRFGSEEKKKRHPMSWLPFGEGNRNCLGSRFGMMQMKIGIVILLSNFQLSFGSKTAIPSVFSKEAIVLTPENVFLKLKSLKA